MSDSLKASQQLITQLPESSQAAIARALLAAFDTTAIDDVRQLTVGLSKSLNVRALRNGRTQRFEDALALVSAGEPSQN